MTMRIAIFALALLALPVGEASAQPADPALQGLAACSGVQEAAGEALDLLKLALKSEPEAMLTLPPVPIEAAADLAQRGARLEDIQDLVRLGFALNFAATATAGAISSCARGPTRSRLEHPRSCATSWPRGCWDCLEAASGRFRSAE